MARACAVCSHPNRDQINQAIVLGEARARIARRWGVSNDSVDRHVQRNHRQVATSAEKVLEFEGESLVDKLQQLITTARDILDRANRADQYGAALAAVRELTRIFELVAKLTGRRDESATVNVAVIQQQQQAERDEQRRILSAMTADECALLRDLQDQIDDLVERVKQRMEPRKAGMREIESTAMPIETD